MESTSTGPLDRHLCQVGGLNQNYTSGAGTRYHIQIEDRGPLVDRLSEQTVRRINVVVYANYGEANERIVYGRDHDYEDRRTAAHNEHIKAEIQRRAAEAREAIEARERRQLHQIKRLFREYHVSKDVRFKQELDALNTLFPFLVSRAWSELKQERQQAVGGGGEAPSEAGGAVEEGPTARVYPLDPELRATVIEIERMVKDIGQDLRRLKEAGSADDILLQTYRKLAARAEEGLDRRLPSQFNVRRLELTRQSLMTTWRQVKSRLKKLGES